MIRELEVYFTLIFLNCAGYVSFADTTISEALHHSKGSNSGY